MIPNYKPFEGGDQNIGGALTGVAIGTFVPALVAVVLRIYVRSRLVRAIGWDDWIIMLAMVCSSFVSGMYFYTQLTKSS